MRRNILIGINLRVHVSLEDSLKLSYKMFRMHYITGQSEYKAQNQGRQSQLDFFFKKIVHDTSSWQMFGSPEGSSICPDAGVQRTI